MFHTYFFLKRLADALDKRLTGLQLSACFSQNKDELMLGFSNQEDEFWIQANLDPNVSLLNFPTAYYRAGKNSIDLFTVLMDLSVQSVDSFLYDRSFQVSFENGYSLIFKMHGRRSNVLLVKNNEVLNVFRNSLKQDFTLVPSELNKHLTINEAAFKKAQYDPVTFIPALGKHVRTHWEETTQELTDGEKWPHLLALLETIDQAPIQLIQDKKPVLSWVSNGQEATSDFIYATNWLYEKTTRAHYFEKEKARFISEVKQKIRQSENYIFKTSEKLRLVKASRSPEEIANIIMANLGIIHVGVEKVTLHDFYHNNFIEIKLNPKLSPQRNAENYYRKSKNRHQEEASLEKNIRQKEQLISTLQQELLTLDDITETGALRKYQKSRKKNQKTQSSHTPGNYHEIVIQGWKVLIGKNAKANDELTLKVAKKNDLWLHAKDVSGSHVVVKQIPGQNYPNYIIEEAAAYAAFFSKRKTESLCPVIYTPKKFVRKVKGAAPGQVMVDKEEVVIVAPKAPEI
ncbi:MAG: NFACT RNA binding domain-containing protein [Bacteroidota bacterium]